MTKEQEELRRQLRRLELEEEQERHHMDRLAHMEEEQGDALFERKQRLEEELETWSGSDPLPFDIMEGKKEVLFSIQQKINGFLDELEQEKRHAVAVREEKRDEIHYRLQQLS